jgi:S-methylmethionine-dependent homocysteine/selenocysteine methylase
MTTPGTSTPTDTAAHRRGQLPQLAGVPMLADGGIETTLIYHDGLDLPLFAAFPLLETRTGLAALRRYYDSYAEVARKHELGLVLESPTWRANPDWAAQLGYDAERLDRLNRQAIELLADIRDAHAKAVSPIVISGCVGPQDDGYNPARRLSAAEAEAYHTAQIRAFADTQADLVAAITMTYPEEAIGIVRAARASDTPVAISLTVETDGRLPSGHGLREAIGQIDGETDGGPDYYMLNCAHPTHFEHVLEAGAPWLDRMLGIRANASTMSHAELDDATELDEGNPDELAADYGRLRALLPHLTVLGGCCGTDERHIDAIATAWRSS